jgi:hypothetical protein
MWLLSACAAPPPPDPTTGVVDALEAPLPTVPYAEVVAALEAERLSLGARAAPREEAREVLADAIGARLLPYWLGTGWDFYGTTSVPGDGDIACGHFVGTLLRDAGFRVDRLAVGRLPSESILGLFATVAERRRFRGREPAQIVVALDDWPDGLYGAGFDFHAGLLRKSGGVLEFCHASPFADEVVCEDPLTSPAFPSRYTVVAPLLTDRAVDAWLDGRTIAVPER